MSIFLAFLMIGFFSVEPVDSETNEILGRGIEVKDTCKKIEDWLGCYVTYTIHPDSFTNLDRIYEPLPPIRIGIERENLPQLKRRLQKEWIVYEYETGGSELVVIKRPWPRIGMFRENWIKKDTSSITRGVSIKTNMAELVCDISPDNGIPEVYFILTDVTNSGLSGFLFVDQNFIWACKHFLRSSEKDFDLLARYAKADTVLGLYCFDLNYKEAPRVFEYGEGFYVIHLKDCSCFTLGTLEIVGTEDAPRITISPYL